MKIKEKIIWRLNLIKDLINKGKFKFSDIFFIFLPNSSLKRKKNKEVKRENLKYIIKNSPINIEKINSNLFILKFYKFKIIIPTPIKNEVTTSIIDFGLPLLGINSYNNKFSFMKREGPYELNECKISKGDFVIDAGANIGVFSILASKRAGENGKIFSFEPVTITNNIFIKNLKINNIKNCQIIKCALGNANKKIDIFINKKHLGASSIFKNKKRNKKETVEQIKLDDFIKKNNIKKIDFIKVDIEGAERYFLEGAKETIKKFKPKISICTYHFIDDKEIITNFLKNNVPEYKIEYKHKKLYAYI